ncbi:cation acetate symporter, partial [Streptomyces sp. NPDC058964]
MITLGHSTLIIVLLTASLIMCLFLCLLAGAGGDEATAGFYTGRQALTDRQNGLAMAGGYLSIITMLFTTGTVALAGADGLLTVTASTAGIALLAVRFAEPLRRAGRYTIGDVVASRLPHRSVRTATAGA